MPNKVQREADLAAYRGVWEQNQRRAAELKARQDELITQARENLKRALDEDKKAGLLHSAALRDVKPVRPALWGKEPEWDWDSAKTAKFREVQSTQIKAYLEHLIMARPDLIGPDQQTDLAMAVRVVGTDVSAAENRQ